VTKAGTGAEERGIPYLAVWNASAAEVVELAVRNNGFHDCTHYCLHAGVHIMIVRALALGALQGWWQRASRGRISHTS